MTHCRLAAAFLAAALLAGCGDAPRGPAESRPGGSAGGAGGFRFVDVAREAGLTRVVLAGRPGKDHLLDSAGGGCAWLDYDRDGRLDAFVANAWRIEGKSVVERGKNALWRNKGDGTFEEIGFSAGTAVNENGSEQGSMGVTAGDYDHDGKLDIFITNFADEYNTLYHNDGKNSFTDLSYAAKVAAISLPHVGWGTKFFDYDNDGWVDLFVANGHVYPQLPGYKQPRLLHRNNRDSTFSEISAEFGAVLTENRVCRGVAFGDVDNDGDVDLLIADLDGPPQLLRNDGANANNSILIKTIGVKSNRSGIGARVTVVSGDLTQTDQVRSGDSYISQSDLRLHFGLEKRSKVDSIQVRWPSGAVDKLSNVGVNRIITIKEGQGKVDEKEFIKQPQKGT